MTEQLPFGEYIRHVSLLDIIFFDLQPFVHLRSTSSNYFLTYSTRKTKNINTFQYELHNLD